MGRSRKGGRLFCQSGVYRNNFNLNAIEAVVQNKPHCIIDYVQLLRSDEATGWSSDSIAISLIEIARRHQVALVAISSMSKGSDGKTSIGSISRGTAQLDYAADLYLLAETKDGQGDEKAVQWKAMKNRRGPLVDLDLIFDGLRQHFRSAMAAAVDETLSLSGLKTKLKKQLNHYWPGAYNKSSALAGCSTTTVVVYIRLPAPVLAGPSAVKLLLAGAGFFEGIMTVRKYAEPLKNLEERAYHASRGFAGSIDTTCDTMRIVYVLARL